MCQLTIVGVLQFHIRNIALWLAAILKKLALTNKCRFGLRPIPKKNFDPIDSAEINVVNCEQKFQVIKMCQLILI